MRIICMDEPAFFDLIDEVLARVSQNKEKKKWIADNEAMQLLKIKSKTTLQKYRDGGWIRFSQPSKKVILYDRDSINEFLEKHAKNIF